MHYYPEDLRYTRYLYAALLLLFVAALLMASGALQVNDNGFTLSIGNLFVNYGG
jgi:hypothetical protein